LIGAPSALRIISKYCQEKKLVNFLGYGPLALNMKRLEEKLSSPLDVAKKELIRKVSRNIEEGIFKVDNEFKNSIQICIQSSSLSKRIEREVLDQLEKVFENKKELDDHVRRIYDITDKVNFIQNFKLTKFSIF